MADNTRTTVATQSRAYGNQPRKKALRKINGNGGGGPHNPLLVAALAHAARAWPVFPLTPRSKVPLPGSRGHLDATTDVATITAWWQQQPDCNIGIATGPTSGLLVVDVDPGGEESLHELEQQGLTLPETLTVRTPRSGWHYYYQYPTGLDIRNSAGKLGPGLDVRADGGYAVTSPSYVLDPGKIDGGYVTETDLPPAQPPPWLVDRLVALQTPVGEAAHRQAAMEGAIPEGQRDDALTSIGGRLRAQGAEHDAILAALHEHNARCEPPLPAQDVEKIARSVCRYPRGDQHQDIVDELAVLSIGEYETIRRGKAKELGWRTHALDTAVEQARARQAPADDAAAGGSAIDLDDGLAPWPEPVALDELLDETSDLIQTHVILSDAQAHIVALWIAGTYVFDAFDIFPILAITSPEPECGKSTLTMALRRLVHRPLATSNISPAALFRVVEAHQPCLMVDEVDSFLKENDELRGILNSGHTKELAYVLRIQGDDLEPRAFSTWSPKTLSMIGDLPPTLHSRSVVIQLRRKLDKEGVPRLSSVSGSLKPFHKLCRKFKKWALHSIEVLKGSDPEIPDALFNRAADNYRSLLAISDMAGGDWPQLARDSALKVTAHSADEKTIKVQLLEDVKGIFDGNDIIFLQAQELADRLNGLEDRPWGDWYGKALTTNQLARMLKPFGIKTTVKRSGRRVIRVYELKSFKDAFDRYLE